MLFSKHLLFSMLFVLLTSVYCEQTTTCSGHVYNVNTLEAVDSATVKFTSIDGPGSILTDANGNYNFQVKYKAKLPQVYVSKDTIFGTGWRECKMNEEIAVDF